MAKAIETLPHGGPKFKKLFVMFACAVFLAPISSSNANFKLACAIHDVDKIKELDWCSFVVSNIVEGFKKLFGDGNKKNKSTLYACVPVLLLAYGHRFVFKGNEMPTTLPLIQHWTNEILEERFKAEVVRGFGKQPKSKIEFPISKGINLPGLSVPQAEVVRGFEKDKTEDSDDRILKFCIPEGIPTNAELEKLTIDPLDYGWRLLKRNMEVVFRDHAEFIKNNCSAPVDRDYSCLASQKFWTDNVVYKELDECTKAHCEAVAATIVANYDLGIGSTQCEEDGKQKAEEVNVTKDLEMTVDLSNDGSKEEHAEIIGFETQTQTENLNDVSSKVVLQTGETESQAIASASISVTHVTETQPSRIRKVHFEDDLNTEHMDKGEGYSCS